MKQYPLSYVQLQCSYEDLAQRPDASVMRLIETASGLAQRAVIQREILFCGVGLKYMRPRQCQFRRSNKVRYYLYIWPPNLVKQPPK